MLGGLTGLGVFALALPQGGIPAEATAVATIIVWWALLVGLLSAGLPASRRLPVAAIGSAGCLALLVALIAFSIAWAPDDERAYLDVVRMTLYLGVFLLVVIATRRGDARPVLTGLAAGLLAVVALALGARLVPSVLTGDQTRLSEFPADGRLGYPIAYWNGLAAIAAAAFVLLSWLGGLGGQPWVRAAAVGAMPAVVLVLFLTGPSVGGVLAVAIGLAALLALAPSRPRILAGSAIGAGGGLVLTALTAPSEALTVDAASGSGGLLGVAVLVATVATCAVAGWARWRLDDRLSAARLPQSIARRAAIAAAALGVVLTLIAVGVTLREAGAEAEPRALDAVATQRIPFEASRLVTADPERPKLWRAALEAFAEQPLRGIGSSGFATYWNEHGSIDRPRRNAHNLYLETLAELGPLGLGFLLAFLGLALRAALLRTFGDLDGSVAVAGALLVMGAFTAGIEWTREIPAVFSIPVLAAALLSGPATVSRTPGAGYAAPGGSRWAAIAVIGLLLAAPVLLSERALDRSREQAGEGRYVAAAESAAAAAALQPWASGPLLQLGMVEWLAGDLDGARKTVLDAIERVPADPIPHYVLSRIDLERDDERWIESYRRAFELSPFELPSEAGGRPYDSRAGSR